METLNLNVLAITPLSVGIVNGGGRTQSFQTIKHLKRIGVHVDLFNPWNPVNPDEYDIVHLFLAGNETLSAARKFSECKAKLVVSPVFFTQRGESSIKAALRFEKLFKPVVRGVFTDYGIKSKICRYADAILPNTKAEARLIENGFGIDSSKINVIPNGVDLRFKEAKPDYFFQKYGLKNFALFAGDASAPRKNIWRLIKAFQNIDHHLVILGSFRSDSYSRDCIKLAELNDRILLLNTVQNDDPLLESAYAAADTFILPSLFETPGIAALEAALAGCKIAITRVGGTTEYFGDEAFYLDPLSIPSIQKAVRSALESKHSNALRNYIIKNFSWQNVAGQTLLAYKKLFK
ncbi:MAG: glycosyltransferase [Balneolaceae bacterium]